MASIPEFSLLALRVYSTPLAIDSEKPNTDITIYGLMRAVDIKSMLPPALSLSRLRMYL